MLNLNSILVSSKNPSVLSEFYRRVLEKNSEWQEGEFTRWQSGPSAFTVGPHDKMMEKEQNLDRILLNFETAHPQGEFDRIKALGAHVILEPYAPEGEEGMLTATLADPDGNYFQLVSPMP